MSNRLRRSASFITVLGRSALALGLMIGCASEEPHVKPGTITQTAKPRPASLSTIKSELVDAKAQLRTTMQALNALQKSAGGDASANYDEFTKQYAKLKTTSEAVSARSIDLKQHVSNYHAMWRREVGLVDSELRRQELDKQADAERIFNTVNSELELTRNSFHPLMANLKELVAYLPGNLVPARLTSIAEPVAKANAQAADVDSHAAAIIAAIEEITAATGETIKPVNVDTPG